MANSFAFLLFLFLLGLSGIVYAMYLAKEAYPNSFANSLYKDLNKQINSEGDKEEPKWCYVGSFENKNGCAEVEKSEDCMSGKIFPSRDICMNEKIRI
jgi:hypothetical protein